VDAFLDRIVDDPSSFLPWVSRTARTIAGLNAYVEQTIKEQNLTEPITERVECGKNGTWWLHLEGANGKTASIRIDSVTVH
jgi:hypothetical protein